MIVKELGHTIRRFVRKKFHFNVSDPNLCLESSRNRCELFRHYWRCRLFSPNIVHRVVATSGDAGVECVILQSVFSYTAQFRMEFSGFILVILACHYYLLEVIFTTSC